jgi:F0F1-type ATP synthase assembly protein I
VPPPPPEAPGLGEQIGATRDAAKRLVDAHVELAKSEFADIADAAKRAAMLVGIALAAGLVAGLIVTVGLPLFLGEAIFGSMGWGILLGVLLLASLALAAAIAALRPGVRAPIGRPFLLGLVVGIVVGLVLGLHVTNRGWAALADSIVPTMDTASRPLVVAVVGLALVGAVVGLIGGAMAAGGGGAIGGLVGGAVAGALLGLLTAFAPGARVGAAIGVAAGLITWTAAMSAGIVRGGFDTDALKDRFYPSRTIEITKETIEWARERMPLSRRS